MRKTRKPITVAMCALVLALGVNATYAYLTDSAGVENTFTVGKVEITLDESKTDAYGVVDGAATAPVTSNSYMIIPGHKYVKDPVVHLQEGSESSYLFVKVANGLTGIEAPAGEDGYAPIAEQIGKNGWKALNGEEGVYWRLAPKNESATDDVDYAVFEELRIAGAATADGIAGYAGKTIEVTAYAIQADGMADEADAWS